MVKTSLVEAFDDRDVIAQIQKLDKTVRDQKDIAQGAVTAAEEARDAAQETADRFAGSVGAVVDQARQDMAQSRADVAEVRSLVAAETETVERLRLQTIALQSTVNNTRDEVQRQAGVVEQTNRNAVVKSGTEIPQVISGSGGLQVAGDMSVGGDLTVAESGHIHMDASDIEVAGMAIEKSGRTTVMSNEGGISFAEDTPVTFGRPPKLGSDSIGSEYSPIYLKEGVPTVVGSVNSVTILGKPALASSQVSPIRIRFATPADGLSNQNIYLTDFLEDSNGTRMLVLRGRIWNPTRHVYNLTVKRPTDSAGVDVAEFGFSTSGNQYLVLGGAVTISGEVAESSKALVTKDFVQKTDPATRLNNLMHTEGNETAQGFKSILAPTIHGQIARSTQSGATPLFEIPATVTESGIFCLCEVVTRYSIDGWMLHVTPEKVLEGKKYMTFGRFENVKFWLVHTEDGRDYVAVRQSNAVAQRSWIRLSSAPMGTTEIEPFTGLPASVSGTMTEMEVVE